MSVSSDNHHGIFLYSFDHWKIHMLSCFIYSSIMKCVAPGMFHYRPLRRNEWKTMFLVSLIFIINIILSNSSIKYNSLALDQVNLDNFIHIQMFRCSMPVFTCVLEYLIQGTVRPFGVYLSLIPVIIGINASVCWWCAHPYWNSHLGWWYCVGSGSSLYQLYNIITQGYCNEIPSFRKRTLKYFPASEHRLFLLSELWIELYVLILWNHLPLPIQG